MTTAHKNLTGVNLHEPKGIATATIDKVYVSDGAGSGAWQKLERDQLDATAGGNSFGAQLFHAHDAKGANTNGGSFTSGAYRTRVLTTVLTNEITGASLASNQITLPAGTYHIRARAPASMVDGHVCKLYNITDGADAIVGSVSNSNSAAPYAQTDSCLETRLTIAGAKVFELQHRGATTCAASGFGRAANLGVAEVYSQVWVWKL